MDKPKHEYVRRGNPKLAKARRRPMPDDFVEQAKSRPPAALAKMYNADRSNTIMRWYQEAGLAPLQTCFSWFHRDKPPLPREAFSGITSRICKACSKNGYSVHGMNRPPPKEWAEIAPTVTMRRAREMYRTGSPNIRYWEWKTGVECGQRCLSIEHRGLVLSKSEFVNMQNYVCKACQAKGLPTIKAKAHREGLHHKAETVFYEMWEENMNEWSKRPLLKKPRFDVQEAIAESPRWYSAFVRA